MITGPTILFIARAMVVTVVGLALLPLADAAAAVHPAPGLYAGVRSIRSLTCADPDTPTTGSADSIELEYPGRDGGTLKYWSTSADNPPAITKKILEVTAGLGTASPSGKFTTVGYSPATGVSGGAAGKWAAQLGFFDANSFTMVLTESPPNQVGCTVVYDIALTRTGGMPIGD